MATTVGQHQVSTITDPADGSSMVASTLRTATSAVRTGANDHDNDSGLHLQSSVAGSRPAAGTAGRKWLDTDTLFLKYDNGVSWDDLNYLKLSGGTLTAGLTVSAGGVTVTGNSTITGTLGGLTGLTMASGTLAAVDLTVSGTFTPNGLTSNGNLTFSGASRLIIPGSTALTLRNVGNSLDAIAVVSDGVNIARVAGMDARVGVASQAATATSGFLIIGSVTGIPSGVVADGAMVIDSNNGRFYVRVGSTWRYATLT